MKIIFDHEVDSAGNPFGAYSIDTADPTIQTMLTALKGNAVAQATAGYGAITKMTVYTGLTRWQAILGEVVRLNDTVARSLLGV